MAYRRDEAEPLDHCGHPLQFAEWLTADHTLPQTPQRLSRFIRIHPGPPNRVGRAIGHALTKVRSRSIRRMLFRHRLRPRPRFRPFNQSSSGVRCAPRSDSTVTRCSSVWTTTGSETALIEMSCSHRLPIGMPPLRMGQKKVDRKRCQEPFFTSAFFGRPRARNVFHCVTICSTHGSLPYGCPLITLLQEQFSMSTFRGRPSWRIVETRPNRSIVAATHSSSPNG